MNFKFFFFSNCINSYNLSSNDRAYSNPNGYIINNCYFTRTNFYSGNGGIIYILDIESYLLIKYSIFFKCYAGGSSPKSGNYGGGGSL